VYHLPVLKEAVISYLITRKHGTYIDGTLGGGGHTEAILHHLTPEGRVIGCDLDRDALDFAETRLAQFQQQCHFFQCNFKDVEDMLKPLNIQKVDGILLDLGISSHQIDTAERGFSFDKTGDLDMRMDRQQEQSAFDIVNHASEAELREILRTYGEERRYRAVVREIVRARAKSPIATTRELKEVAGRALPPQHRVKSLARIFQALRIAVNDELTNLKSMLTQSIGLLRQGGRIVIISYHSLEDRLVKNFFREEARQCVCPPEVPVCVCGKVGRLSVLTRRPILANEMEVKANPRSRSAKLRAAERI